MTKMEKRKNKMNNAIYGKTMENLSNRINVKLIRTAFFVNL